MSRSTPEGKVKNKIDAALKRLTKVYKFMPVQTGYGETTLDYLLCVNGCFVAIEAKAANKDLTPLQTEVKNKIVAAGGIAVRVRDTFELTELIEICLRLGAETLQ